MSPEIPHLRLVGCVLVSFLLLLGGGQTCPPPASTGPVFGYLETGHSCPRGGLVARLLRGISISSGAASALGEGRRIGDSLGDACAERASQPAGADSHGPRGRAHARRAPAALRGTVRAGHGPAAERGPAQQRQAPQAIRGAQPAGAPAGHSLQEAERRLRGQPDGSAWWGHVGFNRVFPHVLMRGSLNIFSF